MEENYDIYSGAKRMQKVKPSPIRVILDKAAKLRSEGVSVIALSAGEPDFNTPKPIKEATIKAIEENYTHYGSNRGVPALRSILSKEMREVSGTAYDPETEVLITSSGAEAINNVLMALLDEGDEVIIFTPAFVSYENLSKLCGAVVKDIPLTLENQFQIKIEDVKNAITNQTKMIILNNPNNPTGAVYEKEILKELCKLVVEHNLILVSDEMYSRLTYEETPFHSVASFPGMKERAVIINGFSKTYAMTGWRLGYVFADARLMNVIVKCHQYSTTCSPTFIQVGLSNSLELPETKQEVEVMIKEFAERRELVIKKLEEIPDFTYCKPYGAFYTMIDVSKTGFNGETFALRLLEEKQVATVPAVGLGKECVDFIRISFAASKEEIEAGLDKMKEFLQELKE